MEIILKTWGAVSPLLIIGITLWQNRKIESIKASHAQELETIKTSLAAQLHVNQTRYTKEYDLLVNLSQLIVELRAVGLRYLLGGENEDLRNELYASQREVDLFVRQYRPFFHPSIGELVDVFLRQENPGGHNTIHTNDMGEWMRRTSTQIDHIQQAIRSRIQYWEQAAM